MAQNHSEPSIPANCTPSTNWFTWTILEQANYKNSGGQYIGKSCLFRPTDTVIGQLEITDVVTDTNWSEWLQAGDNGFYSIDHNDEIPGTGEEHNPWTKMLELYNFHDLEYVKESIEDGDQVVIRHPLAEGGAIIQYAPWELSEPDVDTDVTQMERDQNSIQWGSWTDEEEAVHNYLQLYAFPDNSRQEPLAKLLDTDITDVVLRRKYINDQSQNILEVDYMALSNLLNGKPDSLVGQGLNQQSLGYNANPDPTTGGQVWELYQFSNPLYKTTYTSAKDSGAQVVVREGTHVQYFPVSEIPTGGGGLSGTVSFLGDMRYDTYSHQLQKRVDTLDLATGQVTQGQWTMITGGQAVAHSTVAD